MRMVADEIAFYQQSVVIVPDVFRGRKANVNGTDLHHL